LLALAQWAQLDGLPVLSERTHPTQLACLKQRWGYQRLQTALGIDPD
jgi:hypothetical protein